MNPENRGTTILAGAVFALVVASSTSACSGGDDSGSSDGASSTNSTVATSTVATSAGGTSAATSTSASATTSTETSTTASSSAGGTSTTGDSGSTSGGELPSDMCSGIGNGDACSTPGTCSGRVCGLADTGTRDCTCTTTWDCTSCAWPDPLPAVAEPPAEPLAACDAAVADEVPCDTMGDRCEQGDEVCACWLQDDDGAYIWDCDSAPSFWED